MGKAQELLLAGAAQPRSELCKARRSPLESQLSGPSQLQKEAADTDLFAAACPAASTSRTYPIPPHPIPPAVRFTKRGMGVGERGKR